MSEQTTGATDSPLLDTAMQIIDLMREHVESLLPEGYVIAHVLTADQRDAVIRALNFIIVNEELFSGEHSMNQWADDVETFRSIANGGTDDQ